MLACKPLLGKEGHGSAVTPQCLTQLVAHRFSANKKRALVNKCIKCYYVLILLLTSKTYTKNCKFPVWGISNFITNTKYTDIVHNTMR